jgi:hypothetical protein
MARLIAVASRVAALLAAGVYSAGSPQISRKRRSSPRRPSALKNHIAPGEVLHVIDEQARACRARTAMYVALTAVNAVSAITE